MYYPFFLLAIAWGWGIGGVIALFFPQYEKKVTLTLSHAVHVKALGVVSIAIGILTWYCSNFLDNTMILKILAVLIAVKGVLIVVLPKRDFEKAVNWWLRQTPRWNRLVGSAALVFVWYIVYQIFF